MSLCLRNGRLKKVHATRLMSDMKSAGLGSDQVRRFGFVPCTTSR